MEVHIEIQMYIGPTLHRKEPMLGQCRTTCGDTQSHWANIGQGGHNVGPDVEVHIGIHMHIGPTVPMDEPILGQCRNTYERRTELAVKQTGSDDPPCHDMESDIGPTSSQQWANITEPT